MNKQGASRHVNLLIIGAAKCGTTTLQRHLAKLPQAYFSPVKEPNFHARQALNPEHFSPAFRSNHRKSNADIGWVRTLAEYDQLFEGADPQKHQLIGEASTSTLFDPAALESVRALHPQAKILVALRHPAERMYSHWGMARKYGFTAQAFREAVERDRSMQHPGWGRTELFYELGLYAQQLNPWLEAWPAEQLRIVLTEDLGQPETWEGLAEWLGVSAPDGWSISASATDGRANQGGRARWERMNHVITQLGIKGWMASRLPNALKRRLKRHYYTEATDVLSTEDRHWAVGLYRNEVEDLERLLGRDLNHWKH